MKSELNAQQQEAVDTAPAPVHIHSDIVEAAVDSYSDIGFDHSRSDIEAADRRCYYIEADRNYFDTTADM